MGCATSARQVAGGVRLLCLPSSPPGRTAGRGLRTENWLASLSPESSLLLLARQVAAVVFGRQLGQRAILMHVVDDLGDSVGQALRVERALLIERQTQIFI